MSTLTPSGNDGDGCRRRERVTGFLCLSRDRRVPGSALNWSQGGRRETSSDTSDTGRAPRPDCRPSDPSPERVRNRNHCSRSPSVPVTQTRSVPPGTGSTWCERVRRGNRGVWSQKGIKKKFLSKPMYLNPVHRRGFSLVGSGDGRNPSKE